MWRPFVNADQQGGTSTSLLWINSGPGGALENSPEPSTIRAHIQNQLRATRNRRLSSLQLDGENRFLNWAETRCPTEVSECSNPAIETAFARLRTEGSFLRFNHRTKLIASSFGNADFITSDTSGEQLAHVLADPRHNNEEWIAEDVEEAVATLDPGIDIEPFFCIQIGGLRQDPFSMLPIESTGMVQYAFDYCGFHHAETEVRDNSLCCLPLVVTEYAPVAARTGGFHADLLPLWIGELMQDAMAFEAYLALALSVKRLGVDTDSCVSKAILKYSTNGMSALRRRLLSGTAAISDMVILTIMALAAVQYLAGYYEAYKTHMKALQHIVNLRGGIENLRGLRGYVKLRVTEAISTGNTRIRQLHDLQRILVQNSAAPEMIYPEHPFSPDLCRKITAFPSGFRELALSRKLSMQFIDHLHLIVRGDESNIGANSMDLLNCTYGTTLERTLAIVLCAYTMFLERNITKRPSSLYPTIYLQRQTKLLISDPDLRFCHSNALAWGCLVLKSTTESNTDLWKWTDAKLHTMRVTESRRRELEDAFLTISWLPSTKCSNCER